jgi:hypothetical protein
MPSKAVAGGAGGSKSTAIADGLLAACGTLNTLIPGEHGRCISSSGGR